MWAWVRYAGGSERGGSERGDGVEKMDVDLCDRAGQVCVEMRGVSWEAARVEREAVKDMEMKEEKEERTGPAGVKVRRESVLRPGGEKKGGEKKGGGAGASKPRGVLLAEIESSGEEKAGVVKSEGVGRGGIRLREPGEGDADR